MREYSKRLRVWHWLFVGTVFGMVMTVLLRKTFLSWRTNSELIIDKMATFGIDVTAEQAKIVAQAIRAPMWEWHIILGYVFAFLVLIRVAMIIKEGFGYAQDKTPYKQTVYLLYKVVYLFVIILGVTGIVLHNREALELSKDLAHNIKEFHEILAYVFALFIPVHITGVIIAEIKEDKGIVSKMISG